MLARRKRGISYKEQIYLSWERKLNIFYHVHKDVSDHNHGSLMVIPGLVQCLEEIII